MSLLLLVSLLGVARSIIFDLPEIGDLCITYDLEKGDVMVGNYMLWGSHPIVPDVRMVIKKTNPLSQDGEELFRLDRVDQKGTFAFTVLSHGDHHLCLTPNNPSIRLRGGNMGPAKILINIEEAEIPTDKEKKVAAVESADKVKQHQTKLAALATHVANSKHKFKQFSLHLTSSIAVVDTVSANLPTFSVLFLVITVLFLSTQACYLKSYWKKKKLL